MDKKVHGFRIGEIGMIALINFDNILNPLQIVKCLHEAYLSTFKQVTISKFSVIDYNKNPTCSTISNLSNSSFSRSYSAQLNIRNPTVVSNLSTGHCNGELYSKNSLEICFYPQSVRWLSNKQNFITIVDTILGFCDKYGDVYNGSITVDTGDKLIYLTKYSSFMYRGGDNHCDDHIRLTKELYQCDPQYMRAMPIAWANILGKKLRSKLPENIERDFENFKNDDVLKYDQFVRNYESSVAFFLSQDPLKNCGEEYFPCYDDTNTYYDAGIWLAKQFLKAGI